MGIAAELTTLLAAEERISSDAIRCTIERTVAHLKDTKAKIEELSERRKTALLTASNKELAAIDADLAAERLTQERGEAALRILADRLDAVVELEREARAAEERAKLNERADAVAKKLALRYPAIVDELRALLHGAAEIDSAILIFEKQNPDADGIATVESRVRFTPVSRKVIHEDEVWCWRAPSGKLIDGAEGHDVRPAVTDDPEPRSSVPRLRAVQAKPRKFLDEIAAGRASPDAIYRSAHGTGHVMKPVRARRVIVEVTPCERPSPLATTIRMPPLRAGQPGFGPLSTNDPRLVLAALALPPTAPEPERRVELIEIVSEDSKR